MKSFLTEFLQEKYELSHELLQADRLRCNEKFFIRNQSRCQRTIKMVLLSIRSSESAPAIAQIKLNLTSQYLETLFSILNNNPKVHRPIIIRWTPAHYTRKFHYFRFFPGCLRSTPTETQTLINDVFRIHRNQIDRPHKSIIWLPKLIEECHNARNGKWHKK